MNKKKVVVGMLALALVSVMGLLGCASVDQQTLKKEGVPQDQRATLYWVYYDQRLEKIDGKKQGNFLTLYGILQGLPGGKDTSAGIMSEPVIKGGGVPVQVSAGEHTIVMSDKGLIGRKKYEGTFNFEAGKKYIIQLTTPTLYEGMQKGVLDTLKDAGKDLGNHMKEALAGNLIIIVAESKKATPTFPDNSIKGTDWKKSIK